MKKFTGAATISCAVIALALTACAPQSNENGAASADDAKETPITVAWSADSECGTCHATEQASYDDAACVASTHEGQACISCHADASGLATAHEGKTASDTMPKKLKKTEVPDDACLSCHYGAREELVAATVDVAVVDSKGTEVNLRASSTILSDARIATACTMPRSLPTKPMRNAQAAITPTCSSATRATIDATAARTSEKGACVQQAAHTPSVPLVEPRSKPSRAHRGALP
mgnify:CR=1 FL=1